MKPSWLIAMLIPLPLTAAPFALEDASQLHPDFSATWSAFSSVHNTAVPDGTVFATSIGGAGIAVSSASSGDLTIWNQSAGVLLAGPGPQGIILDLNRSVQGVGLRIQHRQAVAAEYRMDFQDGTGQPLFSVVMPSPGSPGNPAFLGGVDPDGRIRRVVITATPGNFFTISDPQFQLKRGPVTDFASLPVASQQTLEISPTATYLHQGLGNLRKDAATETATTTNENAFSLSVLFPALRAGDMIRAERLGASMLPGGLMNHLIGVFSRTQKLADGATFGRVTGAIPAGIDFYTDQISGPTFSTPTNIPQDFLIGDSNFIKVPSGAAYLFFSLARPSIHSTPVQVRLSHVPRAQFSEWAATFGLFGNLADPQSDLDGDGLTLLEEFAFLKNPTTADSGTPADYSFVPRAARNSGAASTPLTLFFGARLDGPLRYKAEFSSDLVHWSDVVDSSGVVPFYPDESDSSRSVFSAVDPGTGPKRFGRVRIEQVTPSSP